jgi:hypothetical protein
MIGLLIIEPPAFIELRVGFGVRGYVNQKIVAIGIGA